VHDNSANKIITYWYVLLLLLLIIIKTAPPPPVTLYISVPCSLHSHSRVLHSLSYTSPSPTPVNVWLIAVLVRQVFSHHRSWHFHGHCLKLILWLGKAQGHLASLIKFRRTPGQSSLKPIEPGLSHQGEEDPYSCASLKSCRVISGLNLEPS